MDYLFNSLPFRQPNRDDIELRDMEKRGERELDDMEVAGSASAPYDASLSSYSRSAPYDPLNSGNASAPYVNPLVPDSESAPPLTPGSGSAPNDPALDSEFSNNTPRQNHQDDMSVDSGAGSTNGFPYMFNFSFPPGTLIAQPVSPATSEPAFPLLSPINLETRRKRSTRSKNDRVNKVRVVEQTSSIYNIVWLYSARKSNSNCMNASNIKKIYKKRQRNTRSERTNDSNRPKSS